MKLNHSDFRLNRLSGSAPLVGERVGRSVLLMLLLVSVPLVALPPDPGVDWGQDIEIYRLDSGRTVRRLVTDSDTSGEIYVGALTAGSDSSDIFYLWRSTDGGSNWMEFARVHNDTALGRLRDCALVVGHDPAGTAIYAFLLRNTAGPQSGIWLLRFRPNRPEPAWLPVLTGTDAVCALAADRSIEHPEQLYVAWGMDYGMIGAARSLDSGETWNLYRADFTDHQSPAICAGSDSCVYVAAARSDSTGITVERFADGPATLEPIVAHLDSGGEYRVSDVSIAADRTSPCTLHSVIAAWCSRGSDGRVSPRLGWSRDGGVTWGATIWPAVNQPRTTWDARDTRVRRGYDDPLLRGTATMYEGSTHRDTLVYAVTRDVNPTAWEQRRVVNDSGVGDRIAPAIGSSWLAGGGYVVYATRGRNSVQFDGYGSIAVSEVPPDARRTSGNRTLVARGGKLVLPVSLSRPGRTLVQFFNSMGQRAPACFNGALPAGDRQLVLPIAVLPAGIYVGRIETPSGVECFRLVRLR